jgi:hypothetical protein
MALNVIESFLQSDAGFVGPSMRRLVGVKSLCEYQLLRSKDELLSSQCQDRLPDTSKECSSGSGDLPDNSKAVSFV